ncbi:hypothetical protein UlMin_040026 [Ulmus minor]
MISRRATATTDLASVMHTQWSCFDSPPPILASFASLSLDVSSEASTGSGNKLVDVLPGVATKKRLSLCGDVLLSRAQKKISSIEAELKKIEEKLERKKTEYVEKMKNKIALIHKDVEEKRTVIEAKKDENVLKAEEMAAKYHVTGTAPKKLLGCF